MCYALGMITQDECETDYLETHKGFDMSHLDPKCKQKYIWRVQDRRGQGCYCGVDWDVMDVTAKHGSNANPPPSGDKGIDRCMCPAEICGFKTLEQAHRWFKREELRELEEYGYHLVKVKVRAITGIGECQVLATRC